LIGVTCKASPVVNESEGPVVTATSLREKCKGRVWAVNAELSRRFTNTRYRAGYLMADVDAFIDRLEETLGLRPRVGSRVTPADVVAVQFRVVRLRRGYEMREVDEALDLYEERLRHEGWQ
jgi:DivIVA domain-containing protein